MACFVVSAAAGIGTAVARHMVKHHERKLELEGKLVPDKFGSDVKWSKKLSYLELTLFSGSFILALEHLIHDEVTPYPPFLTAAGEGSEAVREMFTEMGTVGVSMLAILVIAWAIGVFIVDYFKFKKRKETPKEVTVK